MDEDDSGSSASSSSSSSFEEPGTSSPASPAPAAPAAAGSDENIDARLEELGGYLKDLQAPCRAYTAGWSLFNLAVGGYYGYNATQHPHDRGVRAQGIMLATISGVNTLLLLAKPMPCRSGWRKFKKMPDGTLDEKRAKLDAGVRFISEQLAADKEFTKPEEHVVAALVGIGFGAGLIFGYDDGLRPGVEAALGVILIAELQFATRPHRTRRYAMDFAAKEKPPAVELSFAPLMGPKMRGLGLVGRF